MVLLGMLMGQQLAYLALGNHQGQPLPTVQNAKLALGYQYMAGFRCMMELVQVQHSHRMGFQSAHPLG